MKIPTCLRRLFCWTALAILSDAAAAAPGDLDVTFNPSGTSSPPGTLLDHFPGLSIRYWKFALQADGRIVSGGFSGKVLAIARWLPDGSLDWGFGTGGRVMLSLSGTPALTGLAVQEDGKIVATAVDESSSVLRFLPNGSLDPAFGSGGISHPPIVGRMGSPVPLSDGKLVAGGSVAVEGETYPFPKLWRLLPDGSLDPSFGSAGGTVLPFRRGTTDSIVVQPDGKIVTAGTGVIGQDTWVLITRFNADGTVDTTFGDAGGTVLLPHTLAFAQYIFVALAGDGKIVVNSVTNLAEEVYAQRLDRLLPDGHPDLSFGTGGHAVISSLLAPGAGVFVQTDGKVVAGGNVTEGRIFLVRLLENGQPDVHFGPDGITEQLGFPGSSVTAWGMLQQPDRKIVIGGELFQNWGSSGMALARYHAETLPGSLSGESSAGGNFPDGGIVAFSVVRGSTATPEASVILRNTGTATLTNLSAKLSGAGANRFTVLSTPPAVLAPGATTTVTVRFLPALEVSSAQAMLTIDTGNPAIEDFVILLRGETQLPEAVLSLFDEASPLAADATVDFGPALETMPFTKVFTLKNTGNIGLLVQGLTVAATGNPGDFTIGPPESDTLAPGASTTFHVTFSPGGPGPRTARLRIASTDSLHPPLEINLTGRLAEGIDAWRLTWFGSAAREPAAADLSDPDGDGIPNLLEYATLSSPVEPGAISGNLMKVGNTLEYSFTRPSSTLPYLLYSLEWTDSLQDPWSVLTGGPDVVQDDGARQLVKFTLPAGDHGKRFVRLRVSRQ